MKTPHHYLLLALASATSLNAVADTELRDLSGFTAIEVSDGIDLELRQGDNFEIEVEADEGDTDNILSEVRNGTLRLRLEPDLRRDWGFHGWLSSNWHQRYRARITLPTLEKVEASGGSDLRNVDSLQAEQLEIDVSGGSDVNLELDVQSLDIYASGGSDAKLSGKADSLVAHTSGGSDLNARDLDARDVELSASGGSDAVITVSERLTIDASGGSDVRYYGDPKEKDIDESGSSDVIQRRKSN